MCGIACIIQPSNSNLINASSTSCSFEPLFLDEPSSSFLPLSYLKARGPDGFYTYTLTHSLPSSSTPLPSTTTSTITATTTTTTTTTKDHSPSNPSPSLFKLDFFFSALHFQGHSFYSQPVIQYSSSSSSSISFILCWNGEVYQGHEKYQEQNQSDTEFVSDSIHSLLENCTTSNQTLKEFELALALFLQTLNAEFAMLLYVPNFFNVYFARDPLGRRSLLHYFNVQSSCFILTSVGCLEAMEVSTLGLHRLNLTTFQLSCIPWPDSFDSLVSSSLCTRSLCDIPEVLSSIPFHELHLHPRYLNVVAEFHQVLMDSVLRRCLFNSSCNSSNSDSDSDTTQAISILFSGGLDCTVLAALCCTGSLQLPFKLKKIFLLNVSFDHPSTPMQFTTPDRVTALESVTLLQQCYPHMEFELVPVDVPFEKAYDVFPFIQHLMYPTTTLMDVSLAWPLYFASLKAPTKYVLSGLGADELLGGYRRHRHTFEQNHWHGLHLELDMDLNRIGDRNLGRDDRIIAHHGKEARYPYLDIHVIQFLRSLPLYLKVDPRLPLGQGDKLLLRLLANRLGLHSLSTLMKRAMQFGTKSAKLNHIQGCKKKVGQLNVAELPLLKQNERLSKNATMVAVTSTSPLDVKNKIEE